MKVTKRWIIFTGITCVNFIQLRWKYTHSNENFVMFNFECDIFFEKMHKYVVNWWNTWKSYGTELYLQISLIRIIATERNNDLIEKCHLKRSKSLIYKLNFSVISQTADKIQRNYIFSYVSIWFALMYYKTFTFWLFISIITWKWY